MPIKGVYKKMKKMIIFEPAMCCSTGVCGPGVDPELLRVSSVLSNLKNKDIIVERYNLSINPQIFVDNKVINEVLMKDGVDTLPVVVLEGEVVKTKGYPTDEEFCEWLEVPKGYIKTVAKVTRKSCGCKDGCC